ncbi:hypothetical protein ACFX5E_05625 [Flavobacterium sp. LS2P90]|uniref:Uncharacterized protein n=1 Tax=Flavobacterium xylosi TaxID=3230415 RepID=A0ABW6HUA3_9FLAO
MKNFILKVLSNRDSFQYETVSYKGTIKIQQAVLSSLKLNNINELRDLYEGVAFIDKFSLKILSILALETFLKLELIDWSIVNPKTYSPSIFISGKRVNVIMSEYGEFPVIDKMNDEPAIITIKKGTKDVWICGFADVTTLNSHQNDDFLKGSMTKNIDSKTTFIGFEHLKSFKNIEELERLLK